VESYKVTRLPLQVVVVRVGILELEMEEVVVILLELPAPILVTVLQRVEHRLLEAREGRMDLLFKVVAHLEVDNLVAVDGLEVEQAMGTTHVQVLVEAVILET
jgi:hypothetical protein